MQQLRFIAVTALALGAVHAQAASGPGSVDTSFGNNGVVTFTIANSGTGPTAAFEQSNGDIVVVGGTVPTTTTNVTESVFIARFTSAGVLDKSFGTNGITIASIANTTIDPIGAGVLPNGDIVVGAQAQAIAAQGAGPTPVTYVLVAYTSGGKLDTTFGSNGIVNTSVGNGDASAQAFMVQPNGQMVIAGNEPGLSRKQAPETILVRYNQNGSLDTTFGSGGIVQVATAVAPGPATIALLSNGDYLAIGPGNSEAEFSSTGALLSSISTASITATGTNAPILFESSGDFVGASTVAPPASSATAAAIARPTPDIVHNPASDVLINRFTETATADSTFTPTTFSFVSPTTTSTNESSVTLIAFSSSNQIIAAGRLSGSAENSPVLIGLARLDANGGLDTTFGAGGVVTNPTGVVGAGALLVQNDGNIVVLSEGASTNGTASLVLVRFLAN